MRGIFSPSLSRKAHYLFVLFFISLAVLLAILLTNIIQGVGKQTTAEALPPDSQGIYDSCVVSDPSCVNHLITFAAGGYKLVVNYAQMYASAADQLNYAQMAQSLGIKITWSMNDTTFRNGRDLRMRFSILAATGSCTNNVGFITYGVNLVKYLPAIYAYYIGDEVDPPIVPPRSITTIPLQ